MATPLPTVAVLSIGQMGLGIARLLLAHNFPVITNVSDRSPATQQRAESASIQRVASDSELVSRADYVLSIVPPRDAMQTAKRILSVLDSGSNPRAGKHHPLYYLELNAVSPDTARNIGALFENHAHSLKFIDGGIIGGPPARLAGEGHWKCPDIPLSGPHSLQASSFHGEELARILNSQHLDTKIGTASGLKCVFAAMSKGFTALALQSFTTAHSLGVLTQLQDYVAKYNPSVKDRAEKSIVGCLPKAYRWVEEMNQIGECFEMEGRWPESANLFQNAANVYEQVAQAVEDKGRTEEMEDLSSALLTLTNSLKGSHGGT